MHRSFHQTGRRYGAGAQTSGLFCLRSLQIDFDHAGSPFSVRCDSLRQPLTDVIHGLIKFFVVFSLRAVDHRISRAAVGENHSRIIGAGVSIYSYHIKGRMSRCLLYLLQHLFRHSRVCNDIREHRSHIRMNHAGTFGDTADAHCFSSDFRLSKDTLFFCIRSHDRLMNRIAFRSESLCTDIDTAENGVHRHRLADDAGGKHHDFLRSDAQTFRRMLRHSVSVGDTLFPSAGVSVAAVDDERSGHRVFHLLHIHENRRRFHHILRKYAGTHSGNLAENQSHIFFSALFQAYRTACRLNPFHTGDGFFFDYLHSLTSAFYLTLSPSYRFRNG